MATLAEQVRADAQRKGPNRKTARRAASKQGVEERAVVHENKHAAKKASYAPEAGVNGNGRPSRKSTRKSANRAKPDANFTLRESLQKGSPEAKARRARAKVTKVRGHSPKI